MWRPALTYQNDEPVAEGMPARFMLATVAGTAAVMTGVVLAGSGALTIDEVPVTSAIVATAGLALAAALVSVRKQIAALPATVDRQAAQHALAFAGVAAALLLSFVFVNRVTDALSTTTDSTAQTVSTQASTSRTSGSKHAYQTESTSSKGARLLACDNDSERAPVTTIAVGATRDI